MKSNRDVVMLNSVGWASGRAFGL